MGEIIETVSCPGNTHHLQQLGAALACLLFVHAQMQLQGFANLEANRQHRVERRHRILEDHGDPVAPDLADFVVVKLEQIASVELNFPGHHLARRAGDETNQRHDADALPTTALADDCQGLAFIQRIRNTIDCFDDAIFREKVGVKIADVKQCAHGTLLVSWTRHR